MYDFDRIINRRGTDCVKYDNIAASGRPEELEKKFFDGGIWMNRDADFNASPAGFYRINVATPRAVLQTALERMKAILIG